MGKHLPYILVGADIQKIHAESGTTTKQLIREVERVTERLVTNKGQCVACIGCIEESNCKVECGAIDDCLEKLAEYETAEEDGRLVVLPCGTVYFIHNKAIRTKSILDLLLWEIDGIDKGGEHWSTREKAEKALKEMEGK